MLRGTPRQDEEIATMTEKLFEKSSASFSADRKHRYSLSRSWGTPSNGLPRLCVFVGLNPSRADETEDDMTVKKCVGFATRWGFGRMSIVNLFSLVATDPLDLRDSPRARDPDAATINHITLCTIVGLAGRVVWAWGSHERGVRRMVTDRLASPEWLKVVHDIDLFGVETGVLGSRTADGFPRHPSRLAYSTPFRKGG
jgi:hypothetical protein